MSASSDAAEQVVKMSLDGTEYAIRIAGKGAKEIGVFLVAAMQGVKRTKGKTRLSSLLKSGKELKVFSLPESDLKRFAAEARKYGVLYAALRGSQHSKDGMVDIMCRAEDASKVGRIFERFSIAAIDAAEIRRESLKSLEERAEQSRDTPEAQPTEKPPQAEKGQNDNPTTLSVPQPRFTEENPTQARPAEISALSGNSSEISSRSEQGTIPDTRGKPSVRKQLAEYRAELDSKAAERDQSRAPLKLNQNQHKQNLHFQRPKDKKGR